MKHIFTLTFATIFCLCIALTSGVAADEPRICIFDFSKILKESSAGKLARQIINKRGQELEKNLTEMQYKKEIQKMRQEAVNNIIRDVFDLVQEIGKSEGVLLIMEKKTAGVMYYSDSIDITDKVITKYNENISELEQ